MREIKIEFYYIIKNVIMTYIRTSITSKKCIIKIYKSPDPKDIPFTYEYKRKLRLLKI